MTASGGKDRHDLFLSPHHETASDDMVSLWGATCDRLYQCVDDVLQQLTALAREAQIKNGQGGDEFESSAVLRATEQASSIVAQRISAFARLHNKQHPRINRLPVEVFSAALALLSPPDLITSTHVCTHWREAALGQATLWSHIDSRDPEYVRVLIERSQGAALHVHIRGQSSQSRLPPQSSSPRDKALESVCRQLVAHMSRIQTLHITNLYLGHPTLQPLLSAPAPELVRFSIDRALEPLVNSTPIPPVLFCGSAVRLRYVSIPSIPFSTVTWPDLHSLECTLAPEDLAEDGAMRIRRIPEVTIHWPTQRASVFARQQSLVPSSHEEVTQFLPSGAELDEIDWSESRIRVVQASNGFVREIRSAPSNITSKWAMDAITRSADTLTSLSVHDSIYTRITQDLLPRLQDLTLVLGSLPVAMTESGGLLNLDRPASTLR